MKTYDIRDFGAICDSATPNTKAIQAAIDACAENGGGRVLFSEGVYITGTVVLRSNVNLHIEQTATLLGSPNCKDYPEFEKKHVCVEKLPRNRGAALIFAEECENISITGTGKIDANGYSFVEECAPYHWGWRFKRLDLPTPPRVVFFAGCRNILVEDITMVNQPAGWSYWVNDCDLVSFDRVKILADAEYPNNDGIHVNSSRNVTVSNSVITTGDDCIVVRGGYRATGSGYGCRNIKIENNICWCDWGKVFEIWSGDCNSEISDVIIQNNFAIRIAYICFSIDMKYGCESTTVKDIMCKDIFVEYDEVQERLQIQKTDEQKYDTTKIGRNELLIFIGVGSLGKNLGDQHIMQIDGKLPYIAYENISFENICENQPYGEILLKIEKLTNFSNVTIDNNNIENIAKNRILTIFEE